MLAQMLSDNGYQTHCVGKTHFFPQRAHLGFQSLESYEGLQNFDGTYVNDHHEWLRERTGRPLAHLDHGLDSNSWNARPSPLPEELHNNTWVVTRGLEFIRRRDKTRPFFLNLSFHRPHPPIDPPQAFYDMYRDRDIPPVPVGDWAACHDVPISGLACWRGRLAEDVLRHSRRAYYAQIAHIDAQIGRLLAARGLLGPTVFIFTSDHGEMLGDHHMFRKTYAYEGSARVPLVIRPLFDIEEHCCDAPVTLTDLYPTILELGGIDPPANCEGRSLLGLCDGSAVENWRTYIHGEHSPCYGEDMGMQFLTDGKEKYIWYTSTGKEQFFDLTKDPDELHDLSATGGPADRLEMWRSRMIEQLAPRTQDGLSDGKKLIPGRLPSVRPELLE
jgi:arylsulfatase A-like enzyme